MKKQTAVEWLVSQVEDYFCLLPIDIIEQAKEMEKEQIIDFTDNYVDNCVIPNENMAIPTIKDVPQYYKETFNNK